MRKEPNWEPFVFFLGLLALAALIWCGVWISENVRRGDPYFFTESQPIHCENE